MNETMTPGPLLVIGAHAGDFVWRAAGAVARHTALGGRAVVVALSYGERGESGDLWKKEGQMVAEVKRIRHAEAAQAAAALGAELVAFDLGDYPLEVDATAMARLVDLMREVAPSAIITHTPEDPYNPDHPVASQVAERARKLASGAGGVPAAFTTIAPPRYYYFEPHQPELCGFVPNVFLDISAVVERKEEAMAAMRSQAYLAAHYRQRGEQRAYQARYFGASSEVTHAEAFQLCNPRVVGVL